MIRLAVCVLTVGVSGLIGMTSAQTVPVLTPDEAVKIALEKNYDLKTASNDAEIARLDNTAGNAGMVPYVSISGSDGYSSGTAPLGGSTPESYGKNLNTYNLAARIDYTLFDGGRMFIARKRLAYRDSVGVLAFRQMVVQTRADVIAAYFAIVSQLQQLVSINEVISLNNERVTIAQTAFSAGLQPKTTLLQASIDLNVYREKAVAAENAIAAAKRAFNLLLCRDGAVPFEVIDSIPLRQLPGIGELLAALDSSSIPLQVLEHQVTIASLNLGESKSALFPKVTVNAGYGVTGSGGNTAWGPTAGAALSVPLYQAGNGVRQVKTAEINVVSARNLLEQTRLELASRLGQLVDEYGCQRKILAIEQENVALARENLDISMQRLRLGQSTAIELRQAEESYADSRTRLITALYNLKISETAVMVVVSWL